MAITFKCSGCGKGYRVGDDKAGKKLRCKDCDTVIKVPADNDSADQLANPDDEFESSAVRSAPLGARRRQQSTRKESSAKRKQASKQTSKLTRPMIFAGGGLVLMVVAAVIGIMLSGKKDAVLSRLGGNANGEPRSGTGQDWEHITPITALQKKSFSVYGIAFSPDGKQIAVAYGEFLPDVPSGATIRIWDVGTGAKINEVVTKGNSFVQFSSDGESIIYGGGEDTLTFLDSKSLKVQRQIHLEENYPSTMQFAGGGSRAFIHHVDYSKTRMYDLKSGKNTAYSPDPKGKGIARFRGFTNAVLLNGESTFLAIDLRETDGEYESILFVSNIEGGEAVKVIPLGKIGEHGKPVEAYDVLIASPDGSTAVVGSTKGDICGWNIDTDEKLFSMSIAKSKYDSIKTMAFSPDGSMFASNTGEDGEVKLWNAQTGKLISKLGGGRYSPSRNAEHITFSNNGKLVAASFGQSRPVLVWDITQIPKPSAPSRTPSDPKPKPLAENTPDKDKPTEETASIEELMNRAVAGAKLVPLDCKFKGLEFTMLAPEGSKVTESGEYDDPQLNVSFNKHLQFELKAGKVNFEFEKDLWQKDQDTVTKAFVYEADDAVIRKTFEEYSKPSEKYPFTVNLTVGHFDFHAEPSRYGSGEQTLLDSLLVLHCVRSATLKKSYKPLNSLEDLKKLGVEIDKDDAGHVIAIGTDKHPLTDATMQLIPKIVPDLQRLNLDTCYLTDAGLEPLARLPKLRTAWLMGYEKDIPERLKKRRINGSGLVHLKNLRNMERLYLTGQGIDDNSLVHLAGLTNLKRLALEDNRITDTGLESLKNMTKLELLWLHDNQLDGSGLVHLGKLSRLRQLEIGRTQVSDNALKFLVPLKNLQVLKLEATPITDAGLAEIAKCRKLSHLNISDTKVGDGGLAHLKACQELEYLNLKGTPMSDKGLGHLQSLPKLEQLNLEKTKVTDTGLGNLDGLNNLKFLDVSGTKVSEEGIKKLKATRPGLEIASGKD